MRARITHPYRGLLFDYMQAIINIVKWCLNAPLLC